MAEADGRVAVSVDGERAPAGSRGGNFLTRAAHALVDVFLEFCHVAAQVEKYLVQYLAFVLEAAALRPVRARGHELAARFGDGCGQVAVQTGRRDLALFARDGHVLRQVLQLAHVARPAVGHEPPPGFVGETQGGHLVLLAHFESELAEEEHDVGTAVAQRRDADGDGVEPVIKVFAETAFGHSLGHVYVRGCHDAHVGLAHLTGSHADVFARFEHTQQACLSREGQLAHLVEEQGPAVGHGEIAVTLAYCPGERSLLMTEEFGVDSSFGNGSAVDGEVLLAPPVAVVVYDTRKGLLAHAVFTGDEHG